MKKEVNQEKTKQERAEEAVRGYLENHLHDVDSYESISFGTIDTTNIQKLPYKIKHLFRANNSIGVPVAEERVFYLDSTLTVWE